MTTQTQHAVLAPIELKPRIDRLVKFFTPSRSGYQVVYGTLPGGNIIIQIKLLGEKVGTIFTYNTAVITRNGDLYVTNVKLPTTRFPELHLRYRQCGKAIDTDLRRTHAQWPVSLLVDVTSGLDANGLYRNMVPNIIYTESADAKETKETKETQDAKAFMEAMRKLLA